MSIGEYVLLGSVISHNISFSVPFSLSLPFLSQTENILCRLVHCPSARNIRDYLILKQSAGNLGSPSEWCGSMLSGKNLIPTWSCISRKPELQMNLILGTVLGNSGNINGILTAAQMPITFTGLIVGMIWSFVILYLSCNEFWWEFVTQWLFLLHFKKQLFWNIENLYTSGWCVFLFCF